MYRHFSIDYRRQQTSGESGVGEVRM